MKKSIIVAGAASVALAAMPVVGAFAATSSVTDNINLTLLSTCALTRTNAVAANAVDGSSSNLSWAAGTETYAITLVGGKSANIGTSTFSVTCNDHINGHYMTAQFTGLNGGDGITDSHIPYNGAAAVADGTSSWNATATANNTLGVTAGRITATETGSNTYLYNAAIYSSSDSKNTTPVSAATFDVTYAVGTSASQAAGSYTGSAAYTLTSGA